MVYYAPDDEHMRLLLDLAHRHVARHGADEDEPPRTTQRAPS